MSETIAVAKAVQVPPAARDAIARLMAQYVNVIDNDELECWPPLFTEKCIYQIISRRDYEQGLPIGLWFCDNRGMLEDRVSSVREVNVFEPQVYRHVIGPTEILGHSGEVYRAQTSYIVVRTMQDGGMIVFSVGRYLDEIVVTGDTALLQKRLVITDSWRYDTLVAIPL
jgi:anthranilate 1,2-dioxygenase small subunit